MDEAMPRSWDFHVYKIQPENVEISALRKEQKNAS